MKTKPSVCGRRTAFSSRRRARSSDSQTKSGRSVCARPIPSTTAGLAHSTTRPDGNGRYVRPGSSSVSVSRVKNRVVVVAGSKIKSRGNATTIFIGTRRRQIPQPSVPCGDILSSSPGAAAAASVYCPLRRRPAARFGRCILPVSRVNTVALSCQP